MLVFNEESLFTKPVYLVKTDARVSQIFYNMSLYFKENKMLPLANILRLRYDHFKEELPMTFMEFVTELVRLRMLHEETLMQHTVYWNTVIGRHEFVNVYKYEINFSTDQWRKLYSGLLKFQRVRMSARGRHGLTTFLRERIPTLEALPEGEVQGIVQYLLYFKFIHFSMNTFTITKYKFLERIEPSIKLELDVKTFQFNTKWVSIAYYRMGHRLMNPSVTRFLEKRLSNKITLSANFAKIVHVDRNKHKAEDHVYCTMYNYTYVLRKLRMQRELLFFYNHK